jgi:hypothetical protein
MSRKKEEREHLVTAYFRRELEKLGYMVEDIEWRLGHCQGDGMAFYGSVSGDSLKTVARRVMCGCGSEKFDAYKAIVSGSSITIGRNSLGKHYSHYNTMDVAGDYQGDMDPDDGAEPAISKAFDNLVKCVDEDIRDVSRRLADEGYKILDAFQWEDECVRTFRTKRFEVRVIELKEEPEHVLAGELDELDYQTLTTGKVRIAGLQVEVRSIDEYGDAEEVVGEANVGYIWIDREKPSRTYHGCLTECLHDAIAQARASLGLKKKPHLSVAA